ncbi:MAG: tripartite tricarboxylate transporter substrate binding protein [Methylobacteriaceae bacterium]|nr:tripartite tricarboxylate transporter substrate binding protein [Methylobacteriaceae bacterium]
MPFVRSLLCLCLCVLALSGISVRAQDYPARPVKIIVPFGAGGPADLYARIVAQHLSDALKESFVVDDRPGAGAVIGTSEVAKAAPDGYTLLMMSNTHTVNETILPNKSYKLMRDLVPVAPVNFSDLVMVVHPSVPAKTLTEFIALAKARPGALNYASSGTGTPYHMAGELFKALSGTDIVHIPYRGSGEARNAVIGGHVQMMIDAVTTMAPNVEAGQVRALGVSGQSRSSVLPDVPTIAEAGVPGYEATIWLGLMAPKGTPDAIVQKLNVEIEKVLKRDDIKQDWAKQGATPLLMSPAEFGEYINKDIEKWAKLIARSGAKLR